MPDGQMRQPGGPTAHVDTFARDNLPPRALWPDMDYGALPELAAYPDRMNAAVTLVDDRVAAGDGDRRSVLFGDLVWSYVDLKDKSDGIAAVLVEELGLVPGNRVLLRGFNNPMMAAAWLGIVKAGGVCVATMPMLRARELAFIIDKAQIALALCDHRLREELVQARTRTPLLGSILTFSTDGDGDADIDQAMAGKPAGFSAIDTAADDVALIAFTSGTTGTPKGTCHFHRDILAMCDTFSRHTVEQAPTDINTGSPPLAFTFGLGANLCFPLHAGGATALVEKPTPTALLETIQRHRCTTLYTAPTMYRAMLDQVGGYDIASLTKCVSAGEHLPRSTWEAWQAATGIPIIDGIGSTEMIHCFIASAGAAIRPGSTGRVVPGYQARIEDDDGNVLAPGEIGNLAVKGPTGCRYLADPERQAKYARDGWNLPGDVYTMDTDGYFWYQARADDMIISSGYNISGPEVENALLDHHKVGECAVVAAPDAQRGTIVKAFVVLRDRADAGPETVKELQDFVKGEIAPYKYPRAVEFIDALPRTGTGKVQRFQLRQREQEGARDG